MNKYYKFNVQSFFDDYRNKSKLKRELESEYNSTIGLRGMDYSNPKVSGGTPSDMVFAAQQKRKEIAEKIAKVDEYFALYDAIMNGLAEADAEFVRLYYMGNRRTSAKNRVMDALEISPATFYRDLGRINALISDIADKHTMFR